MLIFGVYFSHLVVALVDAARAEVSELLWLLLVYVCLQVEELVNQVFALLGLHQHRGRIAGQLRIHHLIISEFQIFLSYSL